MKTLKIIDRLPAILPLIFFICGLSVSAGDKTNGTSDSILPAALSGKGAFIAASEDSCSASEDFCGGGATAVPMGRSFDAPLAPVSGLQPGASGKEVFPQAAAAISSAVRRSGSDAPSPSPEQEGKDELSEVFLPGILIFAGLAVWLLFRGKKRV
ncbi:MAG: hypothetical protein ABIG11_06575 [bacterium]